MSAWPPPLQSTVPNPEDAPPLTLLTRIWAEAYLRAPPETWYLSPRQQSDAMLRLVCLVCRSLAPPARGFDYMVDRDKHWGEFLTVTALGAQAESEAKLDYFIADTNAAADRNGWCAFPAAAYDPEMRAGRAPGGPMRYLTPVWRPSDVAPAAPPAVEERSESSSRCFDVKVQLFALLLGRLSLEEACVVVHEVHEQLMDDLQRRRVTLQ